jgi:hypothetical protein
VTRRGHRSEGDAPSDESGRNNSDKHRASSVGSRNMPRIGREAREGVMLMEINWNGNGHGEENRV